MSLSGAIFARGIFSASDEGELHWLYLPAQTANAKSRIARQIVLAAAARLPLCPQLSRLPRTPPVQSVITKFQSWPSFVMAVASLLSARQ